VEGRERGERRWTERAWRSEWVGSWQGVRDILMESFVSCAIETEAVARESAGDGRGKKVGARGMRA